MRITILFLWAISVLAFLLIADFAVGPRYFWSSVPVGFEGMLVLPGLCFWSGLFTTLIAELLTVLMLKKEKKRIWSAGPFIWNTGLLACYGGLVAISASH